LIGDRRPWGDGADYAALLADPALETLDAKNLAGDRLFTAMVWRAEDDEAFRKTLKDLPKEAWQKLDATFDWRGRELDLLDLVYDQEDAERILAPMEAALGAARPIQESEAEEEQHWLVSGLVWLFMPVILPVWGLYELASWISRGFRPRPPGVETGDDEDKGGCLFSILFMVLIYLIYKVIAAVV
jgi:hypothetical protein